MLSVYQDVTVGPQDQVKIMRERLLDAARRLGMSALNEVPKLVG
jgi:hypothetical protein